jgi:hypothetical protein
MASGVYEICVVVLAAIRTLVVRGMAQNEDGRDIKLRVADASQGEPLILSMVWHDYSIRAIYQIVY